MGNHSFDCPFCEQDRRSVGLRCCGTAIAAIEEERRQHDEEQESRRRLFQRHGIDFFFYGVRYEIGVRTDSVVAFLRALDQRKAPSSALPGNQPPSGPGGPDLPQGARPLPHPLPQEAAADPAEEQQVEEWYRSNA